MTRPRTDVFRAPQAPPKPVTPACPFCTDATWRFNGRSWYACDPVSKKRHVCAAPAALADRQDLDSEANGRWERSPIHEQPHERPGVGGKVVLVTTLAALTGLFVTRALRR